MEAGPNSLSKYLSQTRFILVGHFGVMARRQWKTLLRGLGARTFNKTRFRRVNYVVLGMESFATDIEFAESEAAKRGATLVREEELANVLEVGLSSSEYFARLRHCMASGPSTTGWHAMVHWLELMPKQDVPMAVDYLAGGIAEWPAGYRVAPGRWLERGLGGQDEPRLQLVGTILPNDFRNAAWEKTFVGPQGCGRVDTSRSDGYSAKAWQRVLSSGALKRVERLVLPVDALTDDNRCWRVGKVSHFSFDAWRVEVIHLHRLLKTPAIGGATFLRPRRWEYDWERLAPRLRSQLAGHLTFFEESN